MSRTLEQKRAAHALEKVEQIKKLHEDEQKKYSSYVKSLPAAILMNGLGQAAAGLLARAKGKPEDMHAMLFAHLEEWLCRKNENSPYQGGEGLIVAITARDRNAYLRAQVEALAWLQWLKKFATAYLKQPEGDED
ncbi:type III-B CRISPR module-associated protein Cmr5 [Desulfotomaculum copahuensis]|uniref:CRISPR type III-B/RAMP module-associated protein Cmr5 n=1 Tax=Desulfotomaculum copahuensis TaxID=1838280 RepID=A0A1B7LCL9_9FIRM|nr:type III-B CRISPR module-associated protein Cmr5 [Desulfotomaculum copahuensis]OAT80421.1 type III-B CRISPR module-associated protein Cmr5 [Desulfotomaculum copahuensis]